MQIKKQFTQWTLRLISTGILLICILSFIILNPSLTYANKTIYHHFTIYHNKPVETEFFQLLDQSETYIKTSEMYDDHLHLNICLNENVVYPTLIKLIKGKAFASGFYKEVVLQGHAVINQNYLELNGYKWNLSQLLAHEMIHCYQYYALGLLKSNPIAQIPDWKWEGYAEYISRPHSEKDQVLHDIEIFLKADQDSWAVTLEDGTIAPLEYFKAQLLVEFCLEIKKMKYAELLQDPTDEQELQQELNQWYASVKKVKE